MAAKKKKTSKPKKKTQKKSSEVKANKKVQTKVQDLKITRNGNAFTATWSEPSGLTNKKSARRATKLEVIFYVNWGHKKPSRRMYTYGRNLGKRTLTYNLDRRYYYPTGMSKGKQQQSTSTRYNTAHIVNYVKVVIKPKNEAGYADKKYWAECVYNITNPPKPVLSTPTVNAENGTMSSTVKINHSNTSTSEFYDSVVHVTRSNSYDVKSGGKFAHRARSWYTVKNGLTRKTSDNYTVKYDNKDWQNLKFGQWIKIKFTVYSRGLQGYVQESKEHVFSYPAQAEITGIKITSTRISSALVRIKLKTNSTTNAKVDKVKLQRLVTTEVKTTAEADRATGWEDVANATDDGQCNALADRLADFIGQLSYESHIWYRLVTTHDSLTRYSVPKEESGAIRKSFPHISVAGSPCAILSATSAGDGKTVQVVVAVKNDGGTGVQLSYSDWDKAWKGSAQPSTYNADWHDDGATSYYNLQKAVKAGLIKQGDYAQTTTVYLTGLQDSTVYYLKARRYMDSQEAGTTYGKYTPVMSVTANSAPNKVELTVPSIITVGEDLELSWTYSSEVEQKTWELWKIDGSSENRLDSKETADTFGIIKWSTIESKNVGSRMVVQLGVSTGGDFTRSDKKTIEIVQKPVVSLVNPASTITSLPQGFKIKANRPLEKVSVSVVCMNSGGIVADSPGRNDISQAYGEVILSTIIDAPKWGSDNTLVLDIPSSIDRLVNGGRYAIDVYGHDVPHKLTSDKVRHIFGVNWPQANEAKAATGSYVVGNKDNKTADIHLVAPEGGRSSDVADIYRITVDGPYLIAEGVPFGKTVTDRFAPFTNYSDTMYRVVTRTVERDLNWTDIPYNVYGYELRFDWGTNHVELPYNLSISDAYSKDFESAKHSGGRIVGYWNDGVVRTASLSTELIKFDVDSTQAAKVKELANWSGPVFVRTPAGSAYEANVNVSSFDDNYDSLTLSVSFDAEEIDLSDAFVVSDDRGDIW